MSCLHQLTPGCPSSMKMIKLYLNLNGKIKKNLKKIVPSIILISEETSDNSFEPVIRALLQFQALDCNYFMIKILS